MCTQATLADLQVANSSRSVDRRPEERHRFLKLAPDLNLEIVSPTDSAADVRAKVQACLRNGIQLLWIVEPRRQQVLVHRPERPPTF